MVRAIREFNEKSGLVRNEAYNSLFNEIVGPDSTLQKVLNHFVKNKQVIDSARQELIQNLSKYFNKLFPDMTENQSQAVSEGVLETDYAHLVETYGANKARQMYDDTKRRAEIQKVKANLKKNFKFPSTFYISMAENLGYNMATGQSMKYLTLKNAHQIAYMAETDTSITWNAEAAVKDIDTLASLYAIEYSDPQTRTLASEMMGKSNADAILRLAQEAKDQALARNFNGKPAQMQKGYMRETFNPNVDVIVAKASDVKEFENMGYTLGNEVTLDPNQPKTHKEKSFYMINRDGGKAQYVSGAMSITQKQASGTDLLGVNSAMSALDPSVAEYFDYEVMRNNRKELINEIIKNGGRVYKNNAAVPVVNENMEVTGYRYEMSKKNKKELLQRREEFPHNLAATLASINDKASTEERNNLLIDMLGEVYDDAENKDNFIELSAQSPKKEHRDMYHMIPYEARQRAERYFPKGKIYIRPQDYRMTFGFRKWSVSSMRVKNDPEAKAMAKFGQDVWNMMAMTLNSKWGRRSFRAWGELVNMMKDSVVIKTFTVTQANAMSNTLLTWVRGVGIKDSIRDQTIAWRSTIKYREDKYKLFETMQKLQGNISATERKNLETKKRILESEISTNPVHELIEAGMFQTIVDDLETSRDPFSYKTWLEEQAQPILDKTPSPILKAGKGMMLTQDTQVYKFLSDLGQISDFAARYAMHKHNVEKKGMDKQKSLEDIQHIFVDYNIPTTRTLQFLNDIGLAMFTKYYLRVQRTILQTTKENPARMMGMMHFADMFDLSFITDASLFNGSIMNRIKTPEDIVTGIFETAPINLARAVF